MKKQWNRHRQPEYKKAKRLLNLLKYRRHKKIRESIFNSRKKLLVLRASHNRLKHKYFLKKEKLGFYEIEPLWSSLVQNGAKWSPQLSDDLAQAVPSDPSRPSAKQPLAEGHPGKARAEESQGASEGAAKSMAALLVAKKKYKIHSYLFNVICKFPRKYVYHFFGKDILRKYYTMPFRLNISRFISNKVLRSYYSSISHKALLNLCRKAAKGRRLCIGLPHAARRGGLGARPPRGPQNFIVQKGTESAERAKNFILCLEERLDSTLLRLLHFKPLNSFSSVKRALSLAGRRQKLEVNEREAKLTKYPKYQIKSPWSYFGAGRIRQLISHGHIQINGKKVKSPNTQIRPGDKIHVKGFIVNPETPPFSPGQPKTHGPGRGMRMNHLFTLLLRRFKDQAYLSLLDTMAAQRRIDGDARATEGGSDESLRKPKESSEEALCNYIAALKVKRFTEAFYMTYRNLHLIERTSSLGVASVPREGATRADDHPSGEDFDVEKHVQPVFETIGYNQSIYLLWPVISLLKASLWNSQIKRNLIQSSTRAPRPSSRVGLAGTNREAARSREAARHNIKRKLQNLSKRKKLQTSGVYLQNRQTGSLESSIPNRIRSLIPQNPSWSYTAPSKGEHARGSGPHFAGNAVSGKSPAASAKSFRSYASIVYGTRKCKWIKLQQGSCGAKGSFYNQIPNHTQFFQLELEFFQAVYRGVHGHS